MTFKITNIVPEENNLLAFYQFDNGDVNSNRFPLDASFADIMAWGEARAKWFDEREVMLAELQKQLDEQPTEQPIMEGL